MKLTLSCYDGAVSVNTGQGKWSSSAVALTAPKESLLPEMIGIVSDLKAI